MNPTTAAEREKLEVDRLRKLVPGQRVTYTHWRGDSGEGVVVKFINPRGQSIPPERWGYDKLDGIMIKRDFSSDNGRLFLPLLGEGTREVQPDTLRGINGTLPRS